MTPIEFGGMLEQNIGAVLSRGGMGWAVLRDKPIGLIVTSPTLRYAEPHAVWMPWASPRDILQTSVYFLNELKGEARFLITAREADRTFFDHLCKYGLIRTVGKLRDHYAKGKHAMLYQSVT